MQLCQLALLLVDLQCDFWTPLQDVPDFAAFPAQVRALLEAARAQGLLVVHTQAVFQPDRSDWMPFYRPAGRGTIPCVAGTAGAAFTDFAQPRPGEPVIRKQAFDGFLHTDLEYVLRERGIRAVLVAGLVTSVCVLFTATAAYLRRFVPLLVADACADTPEHHENTLRQYDNLCFRAVTVAQVRTDLPAVLELAAPFVDSSV